MYYIITNKLLLTLYFKYSFQGINEFLSAIINERSVNYESFKISSVKFWNNLFKSYFGLETFGNFNKKNINQQKY